jgi:isoprenylcysteine carboxyl methyltransferase (ICMT) family protein YpbQ
MNIDVVVDDVILILILTLKPNPKSIQAKGGKTFGETNGSLLFLKWQGITFVLQII